MSTQAKQYIEKYYKSYESAEVDQEMQVIGNFLIQHARGTVLDCGCGPVPQLWSIFMPQMSALYAIDLPQESIDFVREKISSVETWYQNFKTYQQEVEKVVGNLPEDYVLKQISKIGSVQQSDMTAELPFSHDFFDTVVSLYSLGCLNNEDELQKAIENIQKVLKPGGTLLHINTNGKNKNDELPAYTWNGLDQASTLIEKYLSQAGFINISVQEVT